MAAIDNSVSSRISASVRDNAFKKTYISKTLATGLSTSQQNYHDSLIDDNLTNNGNTFSLGTIIKIYLDCVQAIFNEQSVDTKQPEIAYVFSSPNFRVLIESECITPDGESATGYYNPSNNVLCLNFKSVYLSGRGKFIDLNTFSYLIKELIRHEIHHAHNVIMRALFPMRPEVNVPCNFISNVETIYHGKGYYGLGSYKKEKYTSISDYIVPTLLSSPIYPLTKEARERFYGAMMKDLNNLRSTLLVCPNNSKRFKTSKTGALEKIIAVQALVSEHYRPAYWWVVVNNRHAPYGNETLTAILSGIQNARPHCIEIPFYQWGFPETLLPLCVDKIKHLPNNTQAMFGYAVSDPQSEKSGALNGDVNWKITSVQKYYPSSLHYFGATMIELDAWIFELPYVLYRALFPNLNSIIREEFQKFSAQSENVAVHCQDLSTKIDRDKCLESVCMEGFSSFVADNLKKDYYIKSIVGKHFNCSTNDDGACVVEQIKSHLKIDSNDPDFLKTIDPRYTDKGIMERTIGHSEYMPIALADLFKAKSFSLFISPWYLNLTASIFAFREEGFRSIKYINQNLFNKMMAHSPNSTNLDIISACTEMGIRIQAESDLGLVHDIIYSTKKHVINHCQKQGFNAKEIGKATLTGSIYSICGITWKYLAGPIITGVLAVKNEVKAGYQSAQKKGICRGVLSAIDRGLETYAEHFIPGAAPVLRNQRAMLLQYEIKKSQRQPRGSFVAAGAGTTNATVATTKSMSSASK